MESNAFVLASLKVASLPSFLSYKARWQPKKDEEWWRPVPSVCHFGGLHILPGKGCLTVGQA